MSISDDVGPDHLVVQPGVFAGQRFWAALDRLADRRGHHGHQRYLVGDSHHINRYALHCVTCGRSVATMVVAREADTEVTGAG